MVILDDAYITSVNTIFIAGLLMNHPDLNANIVSQ